MKAFVVLLVLLGLLWLGALAFGLRERPSGEAVEQTWTERLEALFPGPPGLRISALSGPCLEASAVVLPSQGAACTLRVRAAQAPVRRARLRLTLGARAVLRFVPAGDSALMPANLTLGLGDTKDLTVTETGGTLHVTCAAAASRGCRVNVL